MSDRDQALAIHHEIISPESVKVALDLWNDRPHASERDRMWFVLASISSHAIEQVLARRQRETAHTDEEHDLIIEALINLMQVNRIAPGHADTILELIATINASVIELRAKLHAQNARREGTP